MTFPRAKAEPDLPARIISSEDEVYSVLTDYVAAIAPGAAERERSGAPPEAELALIAQSGLQGIGVPASHGGLDVPPSLIIEVIREIASVDPSVAQTLQTHFSNVDRLALRGTPALRDFFFPRILAGERFGNASTERGGKTAGINTTRAISQPDGSVAVDGRKFYATGALTAQWIVVRAVNDAGHTVNVFVDRHAPGVEVVNDWTAFGQRGTASGTATFTKVLVPGFLVQDNPFEDAPSQVNKTLTFMIHAAVESGIAGGALRDGLAFIRQRARPHAEVLAEGGIDVVAEDPYVQIRTGQLTTKVHAAEALLARAARMLDEARNGGDVLPDKVDPARIAMAEAKAFATEVALEVSSEIFALCGTSATDSVHNLDRHWRNTRTHSLHDSTVWKYRQAGRYAILGQAPEWNAFYIRPGDGVGGL